MQRHTAGFDTEFMGVTLMLDIQCCGQTYSYLRLLLIAMTHASPLRTLVSILSASLLAACGGGSSTNAPKPLVSLTLSATKVATGEMVTLSWRASEATVCEASGAWSGAKAMEGSLTFSPPKGGRYRWILACDGAGGVTEQTVELVVPMPVYPTSYQNAKSIFLDSPSLPAPHRPRTIQRYIFSRRLCIC